MSYAGWKTFETWAIRLELLDELTIEDFGISLDDENVVERLSVALEEYVMEYVESATESNFLRQMATTFMNEVDWEEIAQSMVDDTAYVMA